MPKEKAGLLDDAISATHSQRAPMHPTTMHLAITNPTIAVNFTLISMTNFCAVSFFRLPSNSAINALEIRRDKSGRDESGHNAPGHDEPGRDRSGHDKPGCNEPDEPGRDEPGRDEPGRDEPDRFNRIATDVSFFRER